MPSSKGGTRLTSSAALRSFPVMDVVRMRMGPQWYGRTAISKALSHLRGRVMSMRRCMAVMVAGRGSTHRGLRGGGAGRDARPERRDQAQRKTFTQTSPLR